uniref:Uncharacterized protein n=1 Tax=Chrysemys picta bellii TaxID=8478 RepID=A0A8C3IQ88_CHRPI
QALERHRGIDTLDSNVAMNPFFGSMLHTSEDLWKDEAVKEKMLTNLRAHPVSSPQAGIVSLLCSPDASYITGETVVVGGGAPSRL